MKINFTLFALCFSVVLMAQQHPGTLDYSFGDSGKVISKYFGNCYSMAIQADNKIVCAGINDYMYQVVRYTPAGSLDSSFGNNGIINPVVSGGIQQEARMLIQPDQKIVLTGFEYKNGLPTIVLMRFLPDGSFDSSFGINGIEDSTFGIGESIPNIALQPDGKIVVAGWYYPGFIILRFNPNGTLDESFGNTGVVITDFGAQCIPLAIVIDSSNNIIVGGDFTAFESNFSKFIIARYTSTGVLDPTFGINGFIKTDFGKNSDILEALCLQPDGKIIGAGVTGAGFTDMDENMAIARYESNGKLDDSFGQQGKVTIVFNGINSQANSLLLTADNKILIGGGIGGAAEGTSTDFALIRLLSDGTLDSSFGDSGETITDFGLYETGAHIAFQGNKIILAGTSYTSEPYNQINYALARFYNDSLTRKQIIAQKIKHYIQTHNAQATTLNTVFIYPNPAQNMLHVVGLSSAQTKLTVVDLNGGIRIQAVATATSFNLNVSSLYVGNYLLKIETSGEVVTRQFVKQ
jgi:uncharacterized delta-60 repeat protein